MRNSSNHKHVWKLVDPPNGVKTIKYKSILEKKIDKEENVDIFKTR
jgi:hypothetical protein